MNILELKIIPKINSLEDFNSRLDIAKDMLVNSDMFVDILAEIY